MQCVKTSPNIGLKLSSDSEAVFGRGLSDNSQVSHAHCMCLCRSQAPEDAQRFYAVDVPSTRVLDTYLHYVHTIWGLLLNSVHVVKIVYNTLHAKLRYHLTLSANLLGEPRPASI